MNPPLDLASPIMTRDSADNRLVSVPTTIAQGNRAVRNRRLLTPRTFMAWFAAAFITVFGLVWIYAATMPMAFMDRQYPFWEAKKALMAECRRNDVTVFGDSRALAAVIPGMIDVPITNYAIQGVSPVMTYFAVKRLLSCPNPPRMIIIAHSAFKLSGEVEYFRFAARTGFLNYAEMRQVETDADRLHDDELERLRPADQMPNTLRDWLFQIHFPPFYFDNILGAFVAARLPVNETAMRDNLRDRGHSLFGQAPFSDKPAAEGFVTDFKKSPLVDLYFSRILQLAAARGVPVYLLSMPMNEATCARASSRALTDSYAHLASLSAPFPSVHQIGPNIICWPNDRFGDAWHLNAEGAKVYSSRLNSWLRGANSGTLASEMPLGN